MSKIPPLNRNNDFRRVYAKGRSFVSPLAVTYVRKNRGGLTRVGITTSKKVGNAVTRSRCRRVLRAAYRSVEAGVRPGYDLVFVARGRTAGARSQQVARVLEEHLRQAGVLEDRK